VPGGLLNGSHRRITREPDRTCPRVGLTGDDRQTHSRSFAPAWAGDNRGTHRQRSLPGRMTLLVGVIVQPSTDLPAGRDTGLHAPRRRWALRRVPWALLAVIAAGGVRAGAGLAAPAGRVPVGDLRHQRVRLPAHRRADGADHRGVVGAPAAAPVPRRRRARRLHHVLHLHGRRTAAWSPPAPPAPPCCTWRHRWSRRSSAVYAGVTLTRRATRAPSAGEGSGP
jgi:hypothetical protein